MDNINEEIHAIDSIIDFLVNSLNFGTVFIIENDYYESISNIISKDYHNKDYIKSVLLNNSKIIKDKVWNLHVEYFKLNFKLN